MANDVGKQIGATVPEQGVRNADILEVIDILRGASRGEQDPDLQLTRILADLQGASEDAIRLALADLVRDANSD